MIVHSVQPSAGVKIGGGCSMTVRQLSIAGGMDRAALHGTGSWYVVWC